MQQDDKCRDVQIFLYIFKGQGHLFVPTCPRSGAFPQGSNCLALGNIVWVSETQAHDCIELLTEDWLNGDMKNRWKWNTPRQGRVLE